MIVDSASPNPCQSSTPTVTTPPLVQAAEPREGEPGRRGRGGASLVWELELAWPRVGPFAEFQRHDSKLPVHQQAVRNDFLNLIGEDCYRVFYFARTSYNYDFDRCSLNPNADMTCTTPSEFLEGRAAAAAEPIASRTKDLLDVWLTPFSIEERRRAAVGEEDWIVPEAELHIGLDVHWHWHQGYVQVTCTSSVVSGELDLIPVLRSLRNLVEESFDTLVQNELDLWKEERMAGRGGDF